MAELPLLGEIEATLFPYVLEHFLLPLSVQFANIGPKY
jgi:hypothetical protein